MQEYFKDKVLVSFNLTSDLKFKNQILELLNFVESFPTISILREHDCFITNYADTWFVQQQKIELNSYTPYV